MGRHDEAVAQATRARELDPLSLAANVNLGLRYYYARQYDQTVEKLRFALDRDPKLLTAYEQIARVDEEQGKYDKVVSTYETQLALRHSGADEIAALRNAYAKDGRQGFIDGALRTCRRSPRNTPWSPCSLRCTSQPLATTSRLLPGWRGLTHHTQTGCRCST